MLSKADVGEEAGLAQHRRQGFRDGDLLQRPGGGNHDFPPRGIEQLDEARSGRLVVELGEQFLKELESTWEELVKAVNLTTQKPKQ